MGWRDELKGVYETVHDLFLDTGKYESKRLAWFKGRLSDKNYRNLIIDEVSQCNGPFSSLQGPGVCDVRAAEFDRLYQERTGGEVPHHGLNEIAVRDGSKERGGRE
jgi:hypothetical protein